MTIENFQHIEAHKYYHKISIQEIFQKSNLEHLLKVPYVECAINSNMITDILMMGDTVPVDISYTDANCI